MKFNVNVDWLGDFSQGIAPFQLQFKVGYIKSDGSVILSARYQDARPFSENLAAVQVDFEWGFINPAGETIIAPQFQRVDRDFLNGSAEVRRKSGGPILIDITGAEIVA